MKELTFSEPILNDPFELLGLRIVRFGFQQTLDTFQGQFELLQQQQSVRVTEEVRVS